MKLLILGHGRHGKDTVAEIINEIAGLTFTSSSMFAAHKAVYPIMIAEQGYTSLQQCYDDRANHRQRWYELIRDYNTPDKSRLCRELLETCDMYVGMRCDEEYAACKDLFDCIVWVDASDRHPDDPTMKIVYNPGAMVLLNNNQRLVDLRARVVTFLTAAGLIE